MKIINFTEARKHLRATLDQVIQDADYTVITSRNNEPCVLMSLEVFNSLKNKIEKAEQKKGPHE